ncbi:MAG: peptidoglycan-binding protein [Terriglobia bacterium]|jgi:chitosanase
MLTDLQKKIAQAVVNIFETGSAHGQYGSVTLIARDSGHLTYGRSQTTLATGNLYLLIKAYCAAPGAQFAAALNPYLPRLAAPDLTLDTDMTFRGVLHGAGDDPVMCSVQDAFFDRTFWNPTVLGAAGIGVGSALGTNVVYDSHIQGAWAAMRARTDANHGPASQISEQAWISAYVNERRNWLANNPNSALHPTVYRMDAFLQLISGGKWDLPLPLTVRGVVITDELLSATAPLRVSAAAPSEATLQLQTPPMQGDQVRALQQALTNAGVPVTLDGTFGTSTDAAVRQFQQQKGLTVDGVVGPATRSALGL